MYKNAFKKWSSAFENKKIVELAAHDGIIGCEALLSGGQYLKITDIRGENLHNYKKFYPQLTVNIEIVDVENSNELINSLNGMDTVIYMGHLNHTAHHYSILNSLNKAEPNNIIIGSRFNFNNSKTKKIASSSVGTMLWTFEDIELNYMSKNSKFVGVPNFAWLKNAILDIGWKINDYEQKNIKSSYSDSVCNTFLFYCTK